MASTITLRYDATCRDCGARLPAGTRARYYKRGFIYGLDCHPRPQKRRKNWRRDDAIHSARESAVQLFEGPDGVWSMDEHGNVQTTATE